jgi:hypothetical protein
MKGPSYREPRNINWNKVIDCIQHGIKECQINWTNREHLDFKSLNVWSASLMYLVKNKVEKLRHLKRFRLHGKQILNQYHVKEYLASFHKDYVLIPTDKASNNIAIVCKKFYIQTLLQEVGIGSIPKDIHTSTYSLVNESLNDIITRHYNFMLKYGITLSSVHKQLPILFWTPKMHKIPSKQRFIAASHSCTTKTISSIITKCLKQIYFAHKIYCDHIHSYTGFNLMWIINSSLDVHKLLSSCNRKAKNLITYDFSTLYTSIPHDKLKTEIAFLIRKAFKGMNKNYLKVTKGPAYWTNDNPCRSSSINCEALITLIDWLIDNTYVVVGDKVLRQTIGIPMGTDCAPYLANLFLFSYEFKWMNQQLKKKNFKILNKFKYCARYIDDLLLINNNKIMEKYKSIIYPSELILTTEDKKNKEVHYLDLNISITKYGFSYNIYDKRDSFNFPIVSFPHLSGNIPMSHSYSVFFAQLVRYARGCLHFKDFQQRTLSLTTKLIKQNFKRDKLRSVYKKFFYKYKYLIVKYGNDVNKWNI